MGQVYSVYFKAKVNDIDGATAALRRYIADEEANGRTRFNERRMQDEGVDTATLDGMLRLVFAGWSRNPYHQEAVTGGRLDGGTYITNDFDCCYGWEVVMMDAFETVAPYLKDGSSLEIYPDNSLITLTVRGGKAVCS